MCTIKGMEKMLAENFRANALMELEKKGWSRTDLAAKLGRSPQYVTNYLRGYANPGLDVVEMFATAFGCAPQSLLKNPKKPQLTT